jgi:hypothetical protein
MVSLSFINVHSMHALSISLNTSKTRAKHNHNTTTVQLTERADRRVLGSTSTAFFSTPFCSALRAASSTITALLLLDVLLAARTKVF